MSQKNLSQNYRSINTHPSFPRTQCQPHVHHSHRESFQQKQRRPQGNNQNEVNLQRQQKNFKPKKYTNTFSEKKKTTQDTPLHAGRQCWGKTILPRAGYGLGTYRTVDIFNFSHFS